MTSEPLLEGLKTLDLMRLLGDFDVLLEGDRPGVTARLGFDHDTVCKNNPRLIYCSISGCGQGGPWRDDAGHDINCLRAAGAI